MIQGQSDTGKIVQGSLCNFLPWSLYNIAPSMGLTVTEISDEKKEKKTKETCSDLLGYECPYFASVDKVCFKIKIVWIYRYLNSLYTKKCNRYPGLPLYFSGFLDNFIKLEDRS